MIKLIPKMISAMKNTGMKVQIISTRMPKIMVADAKNKPIKIMADRSPIPTNLISIFTIHVWITLSGSNPCGYSSPIRFHGCKKVFNRRLMEKKLKKNQMKFIQTW